MADILHTTTDAVRSAVGVTASEVSDNQLTSRGLDLELQADLDQWLPTHAAVVTAGAAQGATSEQAALANYVKLYSMWFCALATLNTPALIPKKVTDGKAGFERFDFDLEKAQDRARGAVDRYRSLLTSALSLTAPSAAPGLFSRVTPGYDPVTGT